MARKKKGGGGEEGAKVETAGGLRWLITYADMITLLLGVFIILCAGGAPSKSELQQLTTAFEKVFTILQGGGSQKVIPGPAGEKMLEGGTGLVSKSKDLSSPEVIIKRKYTQTFKAEIEKGKMTVKLTKDAVVIRCYEMLLFDKGSDKINPEAYPTLDRIALLILGIPNKVAIEGHTDATPIHTPRFASNWELSTARATNVLQYLLTYAEKNDVVKSEIDELQRRLSVFGYAYFQPIETDPYSHLNNRLDIIIYHQIKKELFLKEEEG